MILFQKMKRNFFRFIHRLSEKGKVRNLHFSFFTKLNNLRRSFPTETQTTNVTEATISAAEMEKLAQKYASRLLLREEIALPPSFFQHLIELRLFTSIPSMNTSLFFPQCYRCHNRDKTLLATFPCAKCNQTHLYCRNCLEMGRVLACEALYIWNGPQFQPPEYEQPCTWQGDLTRPQKKAAQKIVKAIAEKKELAVWAVTGAGKTEMLFEGITYALKMGKRVCIATPRKDVVVELLPRLREAFNQVNVQGFYGGSTDRDRSASLIVATTHQLLRFYRAFDVIIIDEIDAFPYHHDPALPFATMRAAKEGAAKIYLTATPRARLRRKISSRQIAHCFVPLRYHRQPLPIPQYLYSFSLTKQLQNEQIPATFLHWLRKREKPVRQILLFVPTISLAEQLQKLLTERLNKQFNCPSPTIVASVHAEDPERDEKIRRFRNKEIYLLITTTILERGVTFPSVDVVVLDAGHRIFDEAALVQIAGRAGRNALDPTGEVIFIHDGKTDAMIQAVHSIKVMNRRGKKMLLELEETNKGGTII